MLVGNAGGGGNEKGKGKMRKVASGSKLHLFMVINSKNFALSAATLYVREKININMKSYIL